MPKALISNKGLGENLVICRITTLISQLLQPDLGNRLWYKQHLYTSSVDPQAQVLCGGRFWVAHSGPRA